MVELPHRYTPRELQVPIWRAMDEFRRVLIVCHRRFGKDKLCFNKLIVKAIEKMANYAYYFPTAALGRKALWDNIDVNNGMRVIDHIPPEILLCPPNQTEMKIRLINGSTIQILGTDNLDVVGGNYYGTVWSEMAQQNPMAWDLTRPILSENGGWAWFNGTPRGRNHWFKMFNDAMVNEAWYAKLYTVEDTGYIPASEIDAERKAGLSEAMVKQEFFCDFNAATPGAIFAQSLAKAREQGRISEHVAWYKELPVYSVFDVGAPINQKVWLFQMVGDRINFLESLSGGSDLCTPADWADVLRKKSYSYGGHFLPHDAMGVNGGLWEDGLKKAGLSGVVGVPRQLAVWDGINLAQDALARCWFHSEGCKEGLDALDAYHSKEERDGVTIKDVPVHNWASHFSDAFSLSHQAIQAGLAVDRSSIPRRPIGQRPVRAMTGVGASTSPRRGKSLLDQL